MLAQNLGLWRAIQLTAAVILVACGAWKLFADGQALHPPHMIIPLWLAAAVLANAGVSFGNTRLAYGHLKLQDTRVPFPDLWRVNLWGSLLNLLLPFGLGALLRGAWLKVRHQMPAAKASMHVFETNLIVFTVNLWLLALILAAMHGGGWQFAGLILAGAGMLSLSSWRPLLMPALLPYPLAIAAYLSVSHGLQLDIGLSFLLLLPVIVHASALVVLAPGSLGVTESLFVLLAAAFSLSVSDALWLALITRAAGLVAVILLLLGLAISHSASEEEKSCSE